MLQGAGLKTYAYIQLRQRIGAMTPIRWHGLANILVLQCQYTGTSPDINT
ncbi:hypothetical protein [Bacteroides sp. GM023]|nr:hypothetical protein [Bacteroides sp. GM023]MBD3588750.1 hypothetical protein [Bacteroides sp. GM023]